MTDHTIDLDTHRTADAQQATTSRRHLHEVKSDQEALRIHQQEFDEALAAAPAASWPEAAAKARYLIQLYAESAAAMHPRRQRLIAAVLDDFDRLSAGASE